MKTTELAQLIGRRIVLTDSRTGVEYPSTVSDARLSYGRLRITVDDKTWFEPTDSELLEVQNGS